jgi:hypothetical protein
MSATIQRCYSHEDGAGEGFCRKNQLIVLDLVV